MGHAVAPQAPRALSFYSARQGGHAPGRNYSNCALLDSGLLIWHNLPCAVSQLEYLCSATNSMPEHRTTERQRILRDSEEDGFVVKVGSIRSRLHADDPGRETNVPVLACALNCENSR